LAATLSVGAYPGSDLRFGKSLLLGGPRPLDVTGPDVLSGIAA
jgi:hypothetical protein